MELAPSEWLVFWFRHIPLGTFWFHVSLCALRLTHFEFIYIYFSANVNNQRHFSSNKYMYYVIYRRFGTKEPHFSIYFPPKIYFIHSLTQSKWNGFIQVCVFFCSPSFMSKQTLSVHLVRFSLYFYTTFDFRVLGFGCWNDYFANGFPLTRLFVC